MMLQKWKIEPAIYNRKYHKGIFSILKNCWVPQTISFPQSAFGIFFLHQPNFKYTQQILYNFNITLFRFGEMAMSHTKTIMKEAWTIDEVGFNVGGLLIDCFIPPISLRTSYSVSLQTSSGWKSKELTSSTVHWVSKVVALKKSHNYNIDNMIWKMEI